MQQFRVYGASGNSLKQWIVFSRSPVKIVDASLFPDFVKFLLPGKDLDDTESMSSF